MKPKPLTNVKGFFYEKKVLLHEISQIKKSLSFKFKIGIVFDYQNTITVN